MRGDGGGVDDIGGLWGEWGMGVRVWGEWGMGVMVMGGVG